MDAPNNGNMFFWFFPAAESPETAPVVIWLQVRVTTISRAANEFQMSVCILAPSRILNHLLNFEKLNRTFTVFVFI